LLAYINTVDFRVKDAWSDGRDSSGGTHILVIVDIAVRVDRFRTDFVTTIWTTKLASSTFIISDTVRVRLELTDPDSTTLRRALSTGWLGRTLRLYKRQRFYLILFKIIFKLTGKSHSHKEKEHRGYCFSLHILIGYRNV
jgi:hypothetical protein